jgi:hypothetical protein
MKRKGNHQKPSLSSPTVLERHGVTPGVAPPCWPVSGLMEATSIAFPSVSSKHPVAVMEAEFFNSSTYRCGGSAG